MDFFKDLGISDETDQQDVKDEEPEQEVGSFEALGGSDATDQDGDAKKNWPEMAMQLTKKMLKMRNQTKL